VNQVNPKPPPARNELRAFINSPKGYALVALLALTLIAATDPGSTRGWLNASLAIGAAVLVDVAVALLQQRRRIFPDGAVLTGLIVALVLSTTEPWYACVLAAAGAVLSKHLLKIRRKPVFNPAAVGLLLVLLLFRSAQSWWGGMSALPDWSMLFLLVAGVLVTSRVNKFPQVLTFLGLYFALVLIAGLLHLPGVGDALRSPLLNAALFLAFFMVTDPPTSPGKYPEQVLFGSIAAVVCVAGYLVLGGLSYLLIGLLAANGWHAWRSLSARAAAD